MSKQPKFVIYRDTAHDWRWRLVAANGRIIADSAEGYVSKAGARRAVDTVIQTVIAIDYYGSEVPLGTHGVFDEAEALIDRLANGTETSEIVPPDEVHQRLAKYNDALTEQQEVEAR